MDTEEVLQVLIKNFSREELNTLYFELAIDYGKTVALSKSESALNLLTRVQETGRFSHLVAIIKQQRPHLFADETHAPPGFTPTTLPTAHNILEMDRMALYNFLTSHFNYGQIRTACSDLEIDEKQLSGSNKAVKVRELIVYLENENRLPDLRERLAQHVSGAVPLEENNPFPRERSMSDPIVQSSTLNSLADQIAHNLSRSEIKTVCFDLELDYDDLPGTNDIQRIESLISVFIKRQQIGNLLGYLNREYPFVSWKQEF